MVPFAAVVGAIVAICAFAVISNWRSNQ